MRRIILLIVLASVLAGCGPKIKKPEVICAGQADIGAAIAKLSANRANLTSLKAKYNGRYEYWDERGKHGPDSITTNIRLEPPGNIYVQGDVSIITRAVLLGSNSDEFWFAMKPKDISRYIWGKWHEEGTSSSNQCMEKLWLGPAVWFEAMGVITFDANELASWRLRRVRGYDVLERRNSDNVVLKRIHVYNCNYEVRKIEYFDNAGKPIGEATLDKYEPVKGREQWQIPGELEIKLWARDGVSQRLFIKLSSGETDQFTDKQRNVFFSRPSTKGFETVIRITGDCEFVRE